MAQGKHPKLVSLPLGPMWRYPALIQELPTSVSSAQEPIGPSKPIGSGQTPKPRLHTSQGGFAEESNIPMDRQDEAEHTVDETAWSQPQCDEEVSRALADSTTECLGTALEQPEGWHELWPETEPAAVPGFAVLDSLGLQHSPSDWFVTKPPLLFPA